MNSNVDKIVIIDIWGEFAHFRKGYTSTSPLTYPFPTRTSLAGLISSIIGLKRDSYYELFNKENSSLALQIINPIRKIRITQNLIDTKTGFYLWDNKGLRTQIQFEYLKNPYYRLYIWLKDKDIFNNLIELLKEHKSIYTPYLGISECLLNFNYLGIFNVEQNISNNNAVEIFTVIKNGEIKIELESDMKYGRIKIPGFMDNNRVVKEFVELIYEEDGKPIKIKGEYYKVIDFFEGNKNVNIIFF